MARDAQQVEEDARRTAEDAQRAAAEELLNWATGRGVGTEMLLLARLIITLESIDSRLAARR
jgi:hypothetical protein